MTKHISDIGRADIIAAVRTAALALADMWDTMSVHETSTGEFDGTLDMVQSLAACCTMPPKPDDIPDALIWESVEDTWVQR